jgi:hypothetical protein
MWGSSIRSRSSLPVDTFGQLDLTHELATSDEMSRRAMRDELPADSLVEPGPGSRPLWLDYRPE